MLLENTTTPINNYIYSEAFIYIYKLVCLDYKQFFNF